VALRNKLVHYKSKKVAIDKNHLSDVLWYEDAVRAVRAVNLVTSALVKIDPDAEMDWTNGKCDAS
jgi:hypothetical protein